MPTISTGLHIIRKRVKAGDRYYVYAYRGGPCIHVQDGTRPAITQQLLELAYSHRLQQGPGDTVNALIDLYRESPQFARLADRTKGEYRARLNQLSAKIGRVPLRLVPQLRPELVKWRDEMADTPRAADRVMGMAGTLFAWGADRGMIHVNPAQGIRHLHKVDRSDLIWEPRHWKAVEGIPAHIHRVLTLASLTGLRMGDLLALDWQSVTRTAIEIDTRKTGAQVIIPLHPELSKALGRRGKGKVLLTSESRPWTVEGFKTVWQRHKPEGFDRRFHDLRGTFATRLMVAGFTDQQVSLVMGWKLERIAGIRARYVDRGRVVRAMARGMKKGT